MGHNHDVGNRFDRLSINKKRLMLVLGITISFAVVEVFGGILSNSLALISDAGHMIMDAAAISLSLFAVHLSMRPPSDKNTYSLVRIEIVAAFINGIMLVGIALYIFYEAVQRFEEPPEIKAGVMLGVALAGMLANIIGAYILWDASHDSLNIKGAYLHILSDLAGSFGAVVGGAIILLTGWTLADPVISIFIGILIIRSSITLLKDSLHVLMEGAPRHLDSGEIIKKINSVSGVQAVHDFHIWSLTTGIVLLTAHVGVHERVNAISILEKITHLLEKDYGLDHVTIQVEDPTSGYCKVDF
jgi:cobalt-zinc-cadmium efflux system protein